MLYSHSVGFVVIRYLHLFVFRNNSQSCYIRIPLVSHWFVIRIYSFFAMIRNHVIFAFRWFRIYSLFASIRFSQWFAVIVLICYIRIPLVSQWFVIWIYSFFRNDSRSCYIRIPLVFALIRYAHQFVFSNDSQSCYIRVLLISQWFVICIYSFFSQRKIIFAFCWFRIMLVYNNNNNNKTLFNEGLHWLLNIVFLPMALDV
jgi:hypothetical protein